MEESDSIKLRDDVTLTETAARPARGGARHEAIYKKAGAVHAAPWAGNGPRASRFSLVEDVGRHNAVMRSRGRCAAGVDGSDKIFYTTGRPTSEMVIKAAQMPHPFPSFALGPHQDGPRNRGQARITMIGRAAAAAHRSSPAGTASGKTVAPTLVA